MCRPGKTDNVNSPNPSEGGGSHILVIRLSAMGDVAMTVPVLTALIQRYPHLEITVLTKPFFAPMFAQLKQVEVFEAETKGRHKGVFGLHTLYKDLKNRDIDLVADLHNVLRSKVLKRYFNFGGIPFEQIAKGRREKKALTATKNKVFKALKSTHERYADVLDALGFPVDLSKASCLYKEKLSDKVLKLVGPHNKKWLGIAPFAAFEGKMYPMHLMKEVVHQLNNTDKYKIFLFGGGQQEKQQLESMATGFSSCINVSGTLSFSEELALISNLDAMLSMDSGNGHLAAMYGIPVITIWGVTHPYAGFYPFGQPAENALLANRKKFPFIPTSIYGKNMPEGYEKAMETITPPDVVKKIEKVLSQS
ncbi:glycosyltransferase family 9 protein [Pricia sp. S334]|uniref:Glycosyltransferase family 9 protein n=1 Tax=Pricia mediterranea TaxID=3076079 RepID=A0ABU3L5C3_9FLAO|nr:glycosyltransferase family 9 protein [Pricia sp. S334]MDT7828941.1 glycosyltransferase family 9 protein [Pricia sp. S334]